MNLSGPPVRQIVNYFGKLEPAFIKDHFLVAADDLEGVIGKVKIKQQGSAGGHNGIKGRSKGSVKIYNWQMLSTNWARISFGEL